MSGTQGGAPAFGSLDSQIWQASVVGSLPINQQFALTGKLGLAYADTDASGTVGGVPFGGSNHTGRHTASGCATT